MDIEDKLLEVKAEIQGQDVADKTIIKKISDDLWEIRFPCKEGHGESFKANSEFIQIMVNDLYRTA